MAVRVHRDLICDNCGATDEVLERSLGGDGHRAKLDLCAECRSTLPVDVALGVALGRMQRTKGMRVVPMAEVRRARRATASTKRATPGKYPRASR